MPTYAKGMKEVTLLQASMNAMDQLQSVEKGDMVFAWSIVLSGPRRKEREECMLAAKYNLRGSCPKQANTFKFQIGHPSIPYPTK